MNNPHGGSSHISDLAEMQVVAEVDEADIIHVATGQKAKITVDAIPYTSFDGTVVSVGSSGRGSGLGTVDEAINFEVEVRFDNPDPRLKPGMTADVDIETETRKDVLTAPSRRWWRAAAALSIGIAPRSIAATRRAAARRRPPRIPWMRLHARSATRRSSKASTSWWTARRPS
jgi:multidrug efflux pump subunit AcrA (membrane-fusion protein)